MGLDMIAERLDLAARKAFVDRLDLLKADDVGLAPLDGTRLLGEQPGAAGDVPAQELQVSCRPA